MTDGLNMHDRLNQMRRDAEKGERTPALSKYNLFRALWLRDCFQRNWLDPRYFRTEFNQLPADIKREVDGLYAR